MYERVMSFKSLHEWKSFINEEIQDLKSALINEHIHIIKTMTQFLKDNHNFTTIDDNSLRFGAGINKIYLKHAVTVYMSLNLYERSETK